MHKWKPEIGDWKSIFNVLYSFVPNGLVPIFHNSYMQRPKSRDYLQIIQLLQPIFTFHYNKAWHLHNFWVGCQWLPPVNNILSLYWWQLFTWPWISRNEGEKTNQTKKNHEKPRLLYLPACSWVTAWPVKKWSIFNPRDISWIVHSKQLS